MGGPGVLAPLEKEVKDLIFTEAEVVDLWPVDRDPTEYARRSIYLFRKRNVRYPLFDAFDAPDTQSACPRRATSTHALQALTLLNSDFAGGRARVLADRVLSQHEAASTDECIRHAYKLVLARNPNTLELERAQQFLRMQTERIRAEQRGRKSAPLTSASSQRAAWTDFALALLNSNEFLYVP